MRNKREYIIGIFEEAVVCVLKGEKFNDVENFWLDMYIMKPQAFQKVLTIQEEEILQVAESIEKKMKTGHR
ncbi:hypothetical protein QWY15_05495 [Planococcus sp. N064]|uniref:Uncharacterized protein n=1 Tax=Planococcus liqunii TaxID=3058394 RepID=A0ABT8MPC4_9BACL|nr:hypothetical protein [Planococcus sp. N064]MDN7226747.1 hypothetical protein [Planococcus sp. N064]